MTVNFVEVAMLGRASKQTLLSFKRNIVPCQQFYRLLHDACGLDHLREEHAAFAKELAYALHAGHQGAFDDGYGRGIYGEGLGEVGLEGIAGAFDKGVLEAGFECWVLSVEC